MSQLYARKLRNLPDNTPTGKVVQAVQAFIAQDQGNGSRQLMANSIGLESFSSDAQAQEFRTALDSYQDNVGRMATSLGLEGFKDSQRDSATAAIVSTTDIGAFLKQTVHVHGMSTPTAAFIGMEGVYDGSFERLPGFETYDESANKNAIQYTVAYNMLAGRQNKFGELFFPTVTCSADNIGVAVTIHLTQVVDDFKREISGALAKYNRKNVIRAMIDASILKNDLTRIIPVHRAQSVAKFVANGVVAPAAVLLEGESINTAPLAIGVEMDILSMSSTDTLVAAGAMDITDAIDPDFRLENVYISVTVGADTDVFRIPTSILAGNNFVAMVQDNYKRQQLTFSTRTVAFNSTTKTATGAAPVALASIATNNLQLQLGLDLSGSVNVETGDLVVYGNAVKLLSTVSLASGLVLDPAQAPALALNTAFATAKIVGYDIKGYRTNSNRRQRGQLLTTTQYSQQWAVPLRSPITSLKPVNADQQADTADLATLVAGTFARTSNEAVTTILLTAGMLKDHMQHAIPGGATPEILGVARMLLEPTYFTEELDVATVINSVVSHEKAADIQAVMAQKIRDIIYRLYRDSSYQAVVESQAGGVNGEPTVLIGTDPMTARYLMVDGDNRLAGPDFKFEVVTTPDERMQGKIVIAFGYPEQSNNTFNPMHFGAMLWVPEVTLVIPISRNGQISRELTVQPRFRHVVNVPVMGLLEVKNIPEVVSTKTSIDFREVP